MLLTPASAGAFANQIVSATGTITTTSAAAVLATNMTQMPAAGTYLVFFVGAVFQSITGAGLYVEASIFAGGAQAAESPLRLADDDPFTQAFCCVATVTVDGAQAIEGRWLITAGGGTGSMLGTRSLRIVRVG